MSLNLTCETITRAALGEPAKREGVELLYTCIHSERHKNGDSHPSLKINSKKNVWACFPCGVRGTAWQLAAFIAGKDPGDKKGVSAWLTEHGLRGRGVFSPPNTAATPQRSSEGLTLEQYAAAKKLPVEFLRSLGLSTVYLSKQPAVRIVYFGADGFEKAARFRLKMEKGADDGRFRWKRGSKPLLYGLERIKNAQAQAYCCLVEGESDRQTLCYHGIPALGLPGAGIWREEWAERLGEIPVIYVFVEGDQGGETVLKWLANSKIRERARLVRLRTAKDASALYLANPPDFPRAWKEALAEAVPWREQARIEAEKTSREAWQVCGSLASCNDILGRLPEVMERLHLAREEKTVKLVYLGVTSRLLPKPISVAVKGPSAGGKSYTVEQTLRLFPDDAYYALTAMSERALAYSEEPLVHRMLVVYEAAGLSSDFASYLVRSLLSEGRLRYETVEKTSEGVRPRLIEREGPTGLIVTTTQLRMHAENETRILSITVDDSQEQTRAVFSALTDEVESDECDEFLKEWHALQRWLETGEHRISIPYSKRLAALIPPVAVRLRRDFGAILNLVRAHALLHQASRAKDAQGRVKAVLADYGAVRELVSEIIGEGVELAVPDSLRETVKAVQELCDAGAASVSVSQVANYLKLDRSAASRRVSQALAKGYVKNLEDKRGRPFKLVVGDPMPENAELLPSPETLQSCSVASDSGGIETPLPPGGEPPKKGAACGEGPAGLNEIQPQPFEQNWDVIDL